MKYRVIKCGNGLYAQCRYKYWPFWSRVFGFGRNQFDTVEEAETALAKVISHQRSNGQVIKEWTEAELLIKRGETTDAATEVPK